VIVVSDTSPLSALITIERSELLQSLFRKVLIPPAVGAELRRFHPSLPEFLIVQPLAHPDAAAKLLESLDAGEAEAIVLAQETRADYLLMDEVAGRQAARQAGLRVIGLVGVLQEAKKQRLIESVRDILGLLEAKTTFFISSELKARVLKDAGED